MIKIAICNNHEYSWIMLSGMMNSYFTDIAWIVRKLMLEMLITFYEAFTSDAIDDFCRLGCCKIFRQPEHYYLPITFCCDKDIKCFHTQSLSSVSDIKSKIQRHCVTQEYILDEVFKQLEHHLF